MTGNTPPHHVSGAQRGEVLVSVLMHICDPSSIFGVRVTFLLMANCNQHSYVSGHGDHEISGRLSGLHGNRAIDW